jgi:cellulose synthase/poly-beta-1,6-N-acetylglucosamine synthase-like glycosyltransferase
VRILCDKRVPQPAAAKFIVTAQSITAVVFWLSAIGIVYAYVAYPAVLWVLAAVFGHQRERPRRNIEDTPLVSLLIAAHNEERVIEARIKNALALDYPADRIEIVIASDGSTDRTVPIVRGTPDPRLRLIAPHTRRGKTRVLNEVIPTLQGDIVILSDANTSIEPSAVHRFVDWFGDPAVGVVVGRLALADPVHGKNVDSLYWRYETFLKRSEARLNALLGANGAIYALRRNLFAPIPGETLLDDFVLPLLVKLRTGAEIVYDTTIVAFEETPAEIGSEFKRRSRIGAGGAQSITILWRLLSPTRGWIAFTFASHKVLRWCGPLLLIGALGSNTLLLGQRLYQATLAAQAFLYAASAVGAMVSGSGTTARLLRLTTLFTAMNVALLSGLCRWVAGIQSGIWQPTVRGRAESLETPAGSALLVESSDVGHVRE